MNLHDVQHPNKMTLSRCRPTLVIGGAGFIGSHTVEALLVQGCEVRVLDDLSTGKLQNIPIEHPNLQLIVGDILDYPTVRDAMDGMRWCVHLAAQVSAARSIEEPYDSAKRNILGFINVLEAAREKGIERVIYASSAAVYGDCDHLPLKEDETLKPVNHYGVEKMVDEDYADLYQRLYGLRTLGLRYFNVYGPRQDPKSPYSGVISKFLDCISSGEAPTVYGDGRQTRDFIHVSDVAQANLVGLSSTYTGVCNVATGGRVDLLRLIDVLSDCFDLRVEPEFVPARAGDIVHSCGDDHRLREQLQFAATRKFEEGLADLAHEWSTQQLTARGAAPADRLSAAASK